MIDPPEYINIQTKEDIVEDLPWHLQNTVMEEQAEAM